MQGGLSRLEPPEPACCDCFSQLAEAAVATSTAASCGRDLSGRPDGPEPTRAQHRAPERQVLRCRLAASSRGSAGQPPADAGVDSHPADASRCRRTQGVPWPWMLPPGTLTVEQRNRASNRYLRASRAGDSAKACAAAPLRVAPDPLPVNPNDGARHNDLHAFCSRLTQVTRDMAMPVDLCVVRDGRALGRRHRRRPPSADLQLCRVRLRMGADAVLDTDRRARSSASGSAARTSVKAVDLTSHHRALRGRGWQRGQLNDDRFMNRSRRMVAPQRGHGLPACPYAERDLSK